jgi:hypothetical protein
MIRVRDIFFRRTVAEQIALAIHRPDAAKWMPPRSMRVFLLLTAVAILNLFDLLYTLFAHSIGELREMNPLADSVLQVGQSTLICFKVMLVLFGTYILWKCRRSAWAVPACWILMIAFTGLGIIWCVWVGNVNFTTELQLQMGIAAR